jgi:hypothetical protein
LTLLCCCCCPAVAAVLLLLLSSTVAVPEAVLKAPGFNPRLYEVCRKPGFKAFAFFKFVNLYRLQLGAGVDGAVAQPAGGAVHVELC